jgi:hypothetical protein
VAAPRPRRWVAAILRRLSRWLDRVAGGLWRLCLHLDGSGFATPPGSASVHPDPDRPFPRRHRAGPPREAEPRPALRAPRRVRADGASARTPGPPSSEISVHTGEWPAPTLGTWSVRRDRPAGWPEPRPVSHSGASSGAGPEPPAVPVAEVPTVRDGRPVPGAEYTAGVWEGVPPRRGFGGPLPRRVPTPHPEPGSPWAPRPESAAPPWAPRPDSAASPPHPESVASPPPASVASPSYPESVALPWPARPDAGRPSGPPRPQPTRPASPPPTRPGPPRPGPPRTNAGPPPADVEHPLDPSDAEVSARRRAVSPTSDGSWTTASSGAPSPPSTGRYPEPAAPPARSREAAPKGAWEGRFEPGPAPRPARPPSTAPGPGVPVEPPEKEPERDRWPDLPDDAPLWNAWTGEPDERGDDLDREQRGVRWSG